MCSFCHLHIRTSRFVIHNYPAFVLNYYLFGIYLPMAVTRSSAQNQFSENQLGHPIELVSQFVARQDWFMRRTDQNIIVADVPGHWSQYHLQVTWETDDETLRLDCGLELPVDKDSFQRLAFVICMLNQHLYLGHFGIAPETGLVELCYALPLRGAGGATTEQIEDVVDILLGQCEQAFPALLHALEHDGPPSLATQLVMMPTQGQA